MTLAIDENRMTCPETPHTAVRQSSISWRVTFLRPDHVLTRNQAITAMSIAEVVGGADGPIDRGDTWYGQLASWAAELGLDTESALLAASRPPRWEPAAAV